MACKRWSLEDGSVFSGLCSMSMWAETANESGKCEICVIPEVIPEDVITYVAPSASCRTWSIPAEFYSPLCSMLLMPDASTGSCPICVSPVPAV
jgi:hypothetical protein